MRSVRSEVCVDVDVDVGVGWQGRQHLSSAGMTAAGQCDHDPFWGDISHGQGSVMADCGRMISKVILAAELQDCRASDIRAAEPQARKQTRGSSRAYRRDRKRLGRLWVVSSSKQPISNCIICCCSLFAVSLRLVCGLSVPGLCAHRLNSIFESRDNGHSAPTPHCFVLLLPPKAVKCGDGCWEI